MSKRKKEIEILKLELEKKEAELEVFKMQAEIENEAALAVLKELEKELIRVRVTTRFTGVKRKGIDIEQLENSILEDKYELPLNDLNFEKLVIHLDTRPKTYG